MLLFILPSPHPTPHTLHPTPYTLHPTFQIILKIVTVS
ncbi:hypothetical protein O53_3443 [Microcystis aeruginosa TAIHU98]|uniref:Uncharacterized protein n=1 Tax=Microcystis aeruginosa TAIHU98 TaxID=1134457 RepID=L7E6I2_MICAE|nr:hypothetical protein O53_3443 [Microcystis aeruginosa TAIHU98]ODV36046.1 hypothetical protein BFG60_4487 [Microcystis aeruginosa NIES-98]